MPVTPESAMGWWNVVQTTGVAGILFGIVIYGCVLIPKFIKRWEDHTTALVQIAERLGAIERELDIKD